MRRLCWALVIGAMRDMLTGRVVGREFQDAYREHPGLLKDLDVI